MLFEIVLTLSYIQRTYQNVTSSEVSYSDGIIQIKLQNYPTQQFSLFKKNDSVDPIIKAGQSFFDYSNGPRLKKNALPETKVSKY
jgi:hypothetical protein